MSWTNADGLTVLMHGEQGDALKGGRSAVCATKFIKATFDLAEGTAILNSANDAFIPAGSIILRAATVVKTAAAGGTSVDIGLHNAAGAAIDADGLDAGVTTATLAANAGVIGDGAKVGTGVGAADAYLSLTATGTFTAGQIEVIVEFA